MGDQDYKCASRFVKFSGTASATSNSVNLKDLLLVCVRLWTLRRLAETVLFWTVCEVGFCATLEHGVFPSSACVSQGPPLPPKSE